MPGTLLCPSRSPWTEKGELIIMPIHRSHEKGLLVASSGLSRNTAPSGGNSPPHAHSTCGFRWKKGWTEKSCPVAYMGWFWDLKKQGASPWCEKWAGTSEALTLEIYGKICVNTDTCTLSERDTVGFLHTRTHTDSHLHSPMQTVPKLDSRIQHRLRDRKLRHG